MIRSLAAVLLLATVAACSPEVTPGFRPYGLDGEESAASEASWPASATCRVVEGKADRRCTPGALNPAVSQSNIHQKICVPGWSATVRPPTTFTNRIKRQAMMNYGITAPAQTVELDHLIPISIGGFPGDAHNPTDPRNLAQLWPESWTGTPNAHTKDAMEHAVQAAICADRITLKQGQDQLLAKWSQ